MKRPRANDGVRWTPRLDQAVEELGAAERDYVAGRDSLAAIEAKKITVADAFIEAIEERRRRLPARAPSAQKATLRPAAARTGSRR